MDKYENLNEMQRQAVFQTEGPVLVLAGAGSGKTNVLTHRIAYLMEECGVRGFRILAITFTNKAAKEMRERAIRLVGEDAEECWISTFHSACIRILKRFGDRLGYEKSFTIYDPDDQKTVVKRILKEMNLSEKMFAPKALLSEISKAKDELIGPKAYADSVSSGELFKKKTAEVYERYERTLRDNQAMDFDDIIFNTVRLFRQNPEILDYYQEQFRYIMVDEYQDTNTAQYHLVQLLASKYRNLFVVGDDDQSIYRFRGANIMNILNFEKDFPDACVIRLEQNYRSTGKILDAANHVIRNNEGRKEKKLWTQNETGENIIVHECWNGKQEAAYVAEEIQRLVRDEDFKYSDIAMLFRTNAQSRALEEQMVLGAIPYRLYAGTPFYQRREIKDILCYLRLIANDMDYVAAERVMNVPGRGIGDVTLERVLGLASSNGWGVCEAISHVEESPELSRSAKKLNIFRDLIRGFRETADRIGGEEGGIRELIDEIIRTIGYEAYLMKDDPLKLEDRLENLDELANRADQYEEENPEERSLSGFLDELSLIAAIDRMDESADAVSLMTLHSAKGLEFPVVFMTGMEDGLFPSYMSLSSPDPMDMEEERRLCYVGITRAEKRLYLTYAKSRQIHGEEQIQRQSTFLKELPTGILDRETVDVSYDDEWSQDPDSAFYGLKKKNSAYGSAGAAKRRQTQADLAKARREAEQQRQLASMVKNASSNTDGSADFAGRAKSASPAINQTPGGEMFKVGDSVMHKRFGLGIVTEVKSVNADYQVRVNFAKEGEKLLFAKLSGLKKV